MHAVQVITRHDLNRSRSKGFLPDLQKPFVFVCRFKYLLKCFKIYENITEFSVARCGLQQSDERLVRRARGSYTLGNSFTHGIWGSEG